MDKVFDSWIRDLKFNSYSIPKTNWCIDLKIKELSSGTDVINWNSLKKNNHITESIKKKKKEKRKRYCHASLHAEKPFLYQIESH